MKIDWKKYLIWYPIIAGIFGFAYHLYQEDRQKKKDAEIKHEKEIIDARKRGVDSVTRAIFRTRTDKRLDRIEKKLHIEDN